MNTNAAAIAAAGDPPWLVNARELVGLREIVGSQHEPKVVQFFADAGHSWVVDDETAWCAAFANAMLERAGISGTRSLAARSFLDWGMEIDPAEAVVGDIVVLSRGDPNGWQGHVGFFIRYVAGDVEILGGNQSNAVSVARYRKDRLLGIRRPAPLDEDAVTQFRPGAVSEEVRAVQRRLAELGYPEVGFADGLYGDKTRGALNAFRADNGLQMYQDRIITADDKAALFAAEPRAVSEERASMTAQDLRKAGSRTVKSGDRGIIAVAGATAVSVVGKIAEGSDVAETVAGGVAEVQEGLGFLQAAWEGLGSIWPLLAIAGAGAAAFFIWQMVRARVDDQQTGRHS